MELNKRNIAILGELLNQNDYLKLKVLSEKYKVTDRTIRYDIQKISDFLEENGFQRLENKHQFGVKLILDENLKEFLQNYLKKQDAEAYFYSREERKNIMALMLLESDVPMKIKDFEEYFLISKNTVLKELDELEEWFSSVEIKMIRRPKIGLYVEGSELKKRLAIIDVIDQTIGSEEVLNYINERTAFTKLNHFKFEILFSKIDLEFLNDLIKTAERNLDRYFTDEGYSNLMTHIALMIKRMLLDKNVNLPKIKPEGLIYTREYIQARRLVQTIEKRYAIQVPEEETRFIALHLLGTQVLKTTVISDDGLGQAVDEMIDGFVDIYKLDIGDERHELKMHLIMHLRPAIYRMAIGLKVKNPLHNQVLSEYEDLYLNIENLIKNLEIYLGFEIDEEEKTNITLHFGAFLERIHYTPPDKPRVVLVCASGIGTASMIASQLKKLYDCEIVKKLSARDVDSLKKGDYDYIISTIKISHIDSEGYIRINPMILAKDRELLSKYLRQKQVKREGEVEHLVDKLLEITKNYAFVQDESQLAYEFLMALKKQKMPVKKNIEEKNLSDYLSKDLIDTNVVASDWKDAISKGTALLEQKEKITDEYKDRILETLEDLGPYMAIGPGIFLAHARPDESVLETSMSLITLENPINFGHSEFDPIKLVITLASVDPKSHIKALSELTDILLDEDRLQIILQASRTEEIFKVIKNRTKR
jgi:transcriptional antiterminator/mannitol/fructose-specific phosphotransferase system IIA component (Ntr-type)